MIKYRIWASVMTVAACAPVSAQAGLIQFEGFDGGTFTNSFFMHDLEFPEPSWALVDPEGNDDFVLHLRPNTDVITFDVQQESVFSISVEMTDFEGGFVGDLPSSAIIFRAASGDFVSLHASEIGVAAIVSADINTPGQLTGKPLGEIVSLEFQAANEGNSEIPGVGAFFDDITATLIPEPSQTFATITLLLTCAPWRRSKCR